MRNIKMAALSHMLYTIILLYLCAIPIESRHRERERKKHREPSSLPSQQHHIIAKGMPINLCSKQRDMKLVCYCTPDNDDNGKAHKAECWIFHSNMSIGDPDWTAFDAQTQLQSLAFSVHGSGNLSFIPSSVIQRLKHLEKLTIEYAQIHEIFAFAFGNFTRIHNISLPNNQIRVISAYAFANHMELHELNICRNEIYEIDPFAFINLPNLNRLNLERNRIEMLHEDTFENLDKLSDLTLSHNIIDVITRETFKGLSNLWVLKLDNNKLRYLGDHMFCELWSLIELDLGHNVIEVIFCSFHFFACNKTNFQLLLLITFCCNCM
jgi:Leucine-rich repeat (LRR) protein